MFLLISVLLSSLMIRRCKTLFTFGSDKHKVFAQAIA